MAHRRLIFRERITAIVGSVILFGLVLLSYWYSVQSEIAGLKYIPSDKSPDFLARMFLSRISMKLASLNTRLSLRIFSISPMSACMRKKRLCSRSLRAKPLQALAPMSSGAMTAWRRWNFPEMSK